MSKSTNASLQNLQTTKPRQQRSDKKTRVSPYLDDDTNIKLQMLATATGHSKGSLVEYIVRRALNEDKSVENIQKAHEGRAPREYAIRTLPIGGKLIYRVTGEGF